MSSIFPYQTQEVRDLAWACFAPPLLHVEQLAGASTGITPCALRLTPGRQLWLDDLDRDSSALQVHLSLRPTHRLGVYFEQLWHFFLQQDPATELLAHNLPVVYEGRTLGEFDCIYYCHQRACHVHLELAVKYFLGQQRCTTATSGNARDWLGPNNRDRLDTKLDQLLQRQILLSENSTAKLQLNALGIGDLVREVALKGWLFRPLRGAPPPPPGYNGACELGTWVAHDQLQSFCGAVGAEAYMVIPKMQWLCPARCAIGGETLDSKLMQARATQHFAREPYPLLVAALDSCAEETKRFFVTPERWPDSMQQLQPALFSPSGT